MSLALVFLSRDDHTPRALDKSVAVFPSVTYLKENHNHPAVAPQLLRSKLLYMLWHLSRRQRYDSLPPSFREYISLFVHLARCMGMDGNCFFVLSLLMKTTTVDYADACKILSGKSNSIAASMKKRRTDILCVPRQYSRCVMNTK